LSSPVRRSPVPAILWGRDEDTRLLLRGLLRLNRYPIVHEAATLDELAGLPVATEPRLLVFDAETETDTWCADLTAALRDHPELRAVVILPRDPRATEERARDAGARAVLSRPFAIRDLVTALDRAAGDEGPPVRSS
jgi:DNA-binding NarL/FixJ family response regulator